MSHYLSSELHSPHDGHIGHVTNVMTVMAATVPRTPGGGERSLPWGQFVQASLLLRHSPLGPGTEEASCHRDL